MTANRHLSAVCLFAQAHAAVSCICAFWLWLSRGISSVRTCWVLLDWPEFLQFVLPLNTFWRFAWTLATVALSSMTRPITSTVTSTIKQLIGFDAGSNLPPNCIRLFSYNVSWCSCIAALTARYVRMFSQAFRENLSTNKLSGRQLKMVRPTQGDLSFRASAICTVFDAGF